MPESKVPAGSPAQAPDPDQRPEDSGQSDAALAREANATRRDRVAYERDVAAEGRDQVADERDAQGPEGASPLRDAAAEDRGNAADDRKRSAGDREHAGHDRQAASEELATAYIDYLTGVLRRRAGLAAIQREMDRTARTSEPLILAFIDVDGLKAVNDIQGHQAADAILCEVARCVQENLRSYDVVVRFGGDEFICSLAGQDAAGAQERFEQISTQLGKTANTTFTFGLAERRADEPLAELIARADTAMIATRTRKRERPGD